MSAVTLDYASNVAPNAPTLNEPTDEATNVIFLPALKMTTTDADSDYLRYKIDLCENVAMTTNCSTFDQTVSQTGWSGQDAESSTAYASGTQATYTLQSSLVRNMTYYWRAYAIDPGGSNTWSNSSLIFSFTTFVVPYAPLSCVIQETVDDSSVTITWTDEAGNEDGYEVQRSVNGGGFALLQDLAAGSTSHQDSTISTGNTYKYRVASYFTGPFYSTWCETSTLNFNTGNLDFQGIDLKGLNLR